MCRQAICTLCGPCDIALDLFHLLNVVESSPLYVQAIDATDDSEEPGSSHVKNPSQASLATSTTGALLT